MLCILLLVDLAVCNYFYHDYNRFIFYDTNKFVHFFSICAAFYVYILFLVEKLTTDFSRNLFLQKSSLFEVT